jgi:uncharacterized protein (TIGR02996 family)
VSLFTDAVSFVRAIHAGNFDAAGVFADWLEERGDKRGSLLRKRWKRWQNDRTQADEAARSLEASMTAPFRELLESWRRMPGVTVSGSHVAAHVAPDHAAADLSFRRYVQKQFPLPEFRLLMLCQFAT